MIYLVLLGNHGFGIKLITNDVLKHDYTATVVLHTTTDYCWINLRVYAALTSRAANEPSAKFSQSPLLGPSTVGLRPLSVKTLAMVCLQLYSKYIG